MLYQGKTTEVDRSLRDDFGVTAAIVLKLCDRIEKKGHVLFFDNYFNSYNLLQVLKSKEIFAGGTAREHRFAKPPFLSNKQISEKERGYSEEVISSDGDVVMCKWLDKKTVVMASNFLSIGECDSVRRWNAATKSHMQVQRPEIIKKYNVSMGGVDLFNRLISLYRIKIRSKKWTLRLIFHAVDMAVTNSWLEYKMACEALALPKKRILDLLAFRMQLAETLTKVGKTNDRRRGRPSLDEQPPPPAKRRQQEHRPLPEVTLDTVDHLPEFDDKEEPTRCKNTNCGKFRSHWFCKKCKVHLCLTSKRNCFSSFHSK